MLIYTVISEHFTSFTQLPMLSAFNSEQGFIDCMKLPQIDNRFSSPLFVTHITTY
jgi:hypothetical protein